MDKRGLVIAYVGEGKGKTTAALGLCLRALGHKKKIVFVQFIKNCKKTGEHKFFCSNGLGENIIQVGSGFVGIAGDKKNIKTHRETAKKGIVKAGEIIASRRFEIIVLDEIIVANNLGLIKEEEIIELIESKKPEQTIVLTGRGELGKIEEYCDLITQMKCIKHPFDHGIGAIEGIDY